MDWQLYTPPVTYVTEHALTGKGCINTKTSCMYYYYQHTHTAAYTQATLSCVHMHVSAVYIHTLSPALLRQPEQIYHMLCSWRRSLM